MCVKLCKDNFKGTTLKDNFHISKGRRTAKNESLCLKWEIQLVRVLHAFARGRSSCCRSGQRRSQSVFHGQSLRAALCASNFHFCWTALKLKSKCCVLISALCCLLWPLSIARMSKFCLQGLLGQFCEGKQGKFSAAPWSTCFLRFDFLVPELLNWEFECQNWKLALS